MSLNERPGKEAYWPTPVVIPVFITGSPVITKRGNYISFVISVVAEYLSEHCTVVI